MRLKIQKRTIGKYMLSLTGTALMICLAYFAVKLLPHAVKYTYPTTSQEQSEVSEASAIEISPECKYTNLDSIAEKEPFIIKSFGDGIYVMKDNTYLYRINAKFSQFPPSDKEEISKGITAVNFAELYEIIAYLES